MAGKKLEVQVGLKLNRLTVLEEIDPIRRNTAVLVRCDCGKVFPVQYNSFLHENTKSCGCLRIESNIIKNIESIGKKKKQYIKKDKDWWKHWKKN